MTSETSESLEATNGTISDGNITIGVTVAQSKASSIATIDAGAVVTLTDPTTTAGQNVNVSASNEGSYTASTSMVSTTQGNNAAFSANWLDVRETVRAELGANIADADSVTVSAKTTIEALEGGAEASTGDPLIVGRLTSLIGAADIGGENYDQAGT